jgi:anti-sigma B factor antagonist
MFAVLVIEHIRSDVVILEPRGALTADTEADLQEAVRRQFAAGRVNLILDLTHVPHIDSCGLGRIVQGYVSAQHKGGGLKLMNVRGRNRQTLTVTRLESILEICPSDEDGSDSDTVGSFTRDRYRGARTLPPS